MAPLAAGLEAGAPYLAYEHVDGESLDVALRREPRPPEALRWIALLAGAVDAAHARGLEHGGLHLRDVLVSSEGVCATGFGIARALEHVQLGVPVRRPYTAREMTAGRRWGPPADRFAVAVLAYELLTGARPAGDPDEAVADLRELCPDAADPAGLQQAFRNALADDPAIRSASAAVFASAIERAVGGESPEARPTPRRREPEAGGAGPAGDFPDAPDAAGGGDAGPAAGETAFGARGLDGPAGRGPAGAGDEPPRIVPPAAAVPEDRPGDGEVPRREADEGRSRSRSASRSRRRSRRGGKRRRTGPVVAVRDDVHFDPLDDRGAVEPPAERPEREEDVPPPPSPTSLRAVAPVVAAMAVGVLLTYLLITGLGTPGGGETDGGAAPPGNAAAGGEESGGEVAVPEAPPPDDGPLTLVEEPILTVGDPPPPGAAPVPPADPPGSAPPPPASAPPAAAPRPPASAVAPPAVPPPAPRPPASAVEAAPAPAAVPPAAASAAEAAPPPPPARLQPEAPADDAPPGAAGSLLVRSRPPGAVVQVDGVEVGVTPVEVPDVSFGAHRVRMELPGYRPWVAEVDVSGTEQVRVGASLEPGGRP